MMKKFERMNFCCGNQVVILSKMFSRYKSKVFLAIFMLSVITLCYLLFLWEKLQFRYLVIQSDSPMRAQNTSECVREQMFCTKQFKTPIVAAADKPCFKSLLNLIGSIHFWEPDREIKVYNLGFSEAQLEELTLLCKVTVHWPTGVPSYFPWHANPKNVNSTKFYAWKAFVIKDAVDKYGRVFYIDSGSDVRKPLDMLDEDLESDGYFFRLGPQPVTDYLHPGMLDYFNYTRDMFVGKKTSNSGYQGFIKGNDAYFRILLRTVECASVAECIMPEGSSRNNHRYDQSALSLVIYTSGIKLNHTHYHDFLTYRALFSEDPKIPSKPMVYTARRKSQEYRPLVKRKSSMLDCQKGEEGENITCYCG